MADDLKLYLSQLEIDGKLYVLKDAEARTDIQNLEKTIEDNELVVSASLNDLESRKADKTEIPTKVSELTNDVPFATKEQLDTLSETLSGIDEHTLEELQKIIGELEDSENGNAWITAIDKLAGLNINYTQAEADEYNASLNGAISTETSLTTEQATALNTAVNVPDKYQSGQSPTQADANTYNATLEGAVSTSSTKTPRTVKQYVDAAILAAEHTEEVSITQDTFSVVDEKLTITTTNLNVLKNKA